MPPLAWAPLGAPALIKSIFSISAWSWIHGNSTICKLAVTSGLGSYGGTVDVGLTRDGISKSLQTGDIWKSKHCACGTELGRASFTRCWVTAGTKQSTEITCLTSKMPPVTKLGFI